MSARRKAQIDVIDIPNLEGGTTEKPVPAEPPPEGGEERRDTPKRRRWFWIALGAAAVVAVGGLMWYHLSPAPITTTAEKTPPPTAAVVQGGRYEFDDFLLPLRDKEGRTRILHCGFVVETDPGRAAAPAGRQEEIRRAIYGVLKNAQREDLLTPEGKKDLKREIATALETLLGAGAVKEVFTSRYILL